MSTLKQVIGSLAANFHRISRRFNQLMIIMEHFGFSLPEQLEIPRYRQPKFCMLQIDDSDECEEDRVCDEAEREDNEAGDCEDERAKEDADQQESPP